ncbi:MAG: long-chain-fatty-acid--CoA ligase [Actinomycetota bacterium]|nr:MAG: long-chain-fatty-acid--CoA ligase [Actinomycetota bacterium]
MLNQGVGSWPVRRLRRSPEVKAIVYKDRSWTYAEIFDRITKLGSALAATGITRSDRVAYLGPNHPALIETLFAAHLLGAIFVPLNSRLAAPEIEYMLADSGAKVLVYAPESQALAAGIKNFPGMRIALESSGTMDIDYEEFLGSGTLEKIDVRIGLDDPAMILFTSGTTGRPKGAILTHGNLHWNCFNVLLDLPLGNDEVTLIGAPLFHVAALNQMFLTTFMRGGTAVIMPSWNVDECFDLIEAHKVTWLFGVTRMYADLAQSPRWETADLSSLRSLMSGGAPIPESLIITYQDRGLVFVQAYGMTETSPGVTMLVPEKSTLKVGSAGTPCFFVDVRIVRSDMSEVDVDEPGEIIVNGPNVTVGYWNNQDATNSAFSDGNWLHTGDIARRDGEGYIYIIDRIKDMYISGGENVYPAEVEAVIFSHPAVAECAVIGVPDEKWGEVGAAFISPKEPDGVSADEIRSYLSARLAKYKVPVYIYFEASLPRTGAGKLQKADLRKSFKDRAARAQSTKGE